MGQMPSGKVSGASLAYGTNSLNWSILCLDKASAAQFCLPGTCLAKKRVLVLRLSSTIIRISFMQCLQLEVFLFTM